ncbi:MAG: hypothetical protein KGH98_02175 [Candidatus Micrarchaeota archaeon]|nr:hypothetical protein [Candidatus Micrarchaeota archaeon]
MDEGYEEALGQISRLGSKKAESAEYIDITETFSVEGPERPEPYSKLAGLLEGMEAVRPRREEMRAEAAPQPGAEARAMIQPAQRMAKATGKEAAALGGALVKGAEATATASARIGSMIGEELGSALAREVKQLGTQLPRVTNTVRRMTERRIDTSGLVLPNLPMQDQISELERIIEGLNENIFNTEQASIVREELLGLSQVAPSQAKGADPALVQLRDSRLQTALGMLGSRVN